MNEFANMLSEIEHYNYIDKKQLLDDIKNYHYVIIYSFSKVKVDYAEKITADMIEKFSELRAFDEDGELVVRSYNNEYKGRIRNDGRGKSAEYIDECHLIWGDENKNQALSETYTFLSEARGVELTVPFDVPLGQNAFIKIRNYLSDDTDILEFSDWRMVEFFTQKVVKEED